MWEFPQPLVVMRFTGPLLTTSGSGIAFIFNNVPECFSASPSVYYVPQVLDLGFC